MTVADRARAAALPFEAKKDGLTQLQSGDWKFTLTVSQQDMPSAILGAIMGTRYVCALVEKGDDEEPVQRKERTPWSQMPRVKQAGILCADERFQEWLGCSGEMLTTVAVRRHCGVTTRVHLDTNETAGKEWDGLVFNYHTATGQLPEMTGSR